MVLPLNVSNLPPQTQYAQIFGFAEDVPFSWTDDQKIGALLQSFPSIDLDSFQINHEVLCFEADFKDLTVTADVDFTAEWINLDTETPIFTHTFKLTKEQINGWGGTFFIRFWIGKCSWELNGPMNVMINVMMDSADPGARGDGRFYIQVTGEPIPEECKESDIDLVLGSALPVGRDVSVNGYVSTSNPDCSINQVTWDWGDGTGSESAFFPNTHTYAADGIYLLAVTAEDDCCNSETKNTFIAIGLDADEVAFTDQMHLMGFGGDIITSIISLAREFWEGVGHWAWVAADHLHHFFWDREFSQADAQAWARDVGQWWPFTNGMSVILWEKNLEGKTQTELSEKDVGELALIIAASALGVALWTKFGAALVAKFGSAKAAAATTTIGGWETAVTAGGGNLANYKIIVGSMASGAAMSTGAKILALAMTPFIITEFPQLWAMLTFARFEVPDHISREFSLLENAFDREMWLFKDNLAAGNLVEAGTNLGAMKSAINEYTLRLADYETDMKDFGLWELHVQTLAALEHGYETFKLSWETAGGEPPEPETGTLQLSVTPEDATITIADHPEINSPGNYSLAPGSYSVQAMKEGFYTKTVTAYINAGETYVLSIILTEEPPTPPPTPEKATLQIMSTPTAAKIYIDGTYKFVVTPFTILLDPGTYVIRVELEGFDAIEESITLTEGEERQYMALFEGEIPYYPPEEEVIIEAVPIDYEYNSWKYKFIAKDSITGVEINMKIYIDGEDTGFWTPRYFYFLPETTYVMKFTRYGYHDADVTIETAPLPTPP